MCERVRHDSTLRLALETVVANGVCRAKSFLNIPFFEETLVFGLTGPYPCEEIGLELETHRQIVSLSLACSGLSGVNPVGNPQQPLDVMPNLVSDHISLGEITWRAQALFHIAIKREIDIDLLIARAVKRPGRASGHSASRLHPIREKNQCGIAVLLAGLAEDPSPDLFSVSKNHRDKTLKIVFGRAYRTRGTSGRGRFFSPCLIQNRSGIDPKERCYQQNDNRAESAADGQPSGRDSSTVFYVVAFASSPPQHSDTPFLYLFKS